MAPSVAVGIGGDCMSRIEAYLPQTAQWQAQTTPNDYGEMQHTTAVGIKCRIEPKARFSHRLEGVEVTATTLVLTTALVSVQDKIDGRDVVAVDVMNMGSGEYSHREVWLR